MHERSGTGCPPMKTLRAGSAGLPIAWQSGDGAAVGDCFFELLCIRNTSRSPGNKLE